MTSAKLNKRFKWELITIFTAFSVVIMAGSCSKSPSSQNKMAMYENFYFTRSPRFTKFRTRVEDGKKIAHVYLEVLDQKRFLLSELPEEIAAKLLEKSSQVLGPDTNYTDLSSWFTYRNGELTYAVLHADSDLFRISPNREGPYLDFPIDRETLLKTFGEPIRWQRPYARPHGP